MGVATITSGYGVLLIAAAVGFVLLTRRGDPERRATRVLIAGGAMCLAWFAPFMGDPEGLWGAYVSTGAAMAVMLSGLEWRRELGKDRIDPMPTARVSDWSVRWATKGMGGIVRSPKQEGPRVWRGPRLSR